MFAENPPAEYPWPAHIAIITASLRSTLRPKRAVKSSLLSNVVGAQPELELGPVLEELLVQEARDHGIRAHQLLVHRRIQGAPARRLRGADEPRPAHPREVVAWPVVVVLGEQRIERCRLRVVGAQDAVERLEHHRLAVLPGAEGEEQQLLFRAAGEAVAHAPLQEADAL